MKAGILLALLQAATEFLPVSSSGHLALAANIISEPNLFFFTALHMASLIAVIIFTRKEIAELLSFKKDSRTIWLYLAIATLPAAAFGFFFRKTVESAFSSLTAIGIAFIITGAILFLTKFARRRAVITSKSASLIGISQAFALFPGISRSGMTISAGLFLGMEPGKAVRFSFLLYIPLSLGAFILEAEKGAYFNGTLLVSFLVCLFASLFFLRALLALVKRGRLWMFSFYCVLLGCVTLFMAHSENMVPIKKSGTAYAQTEKKLERQDLLIEVSDRTWEIFEDVQRFEPIKMTFDPGRGKGKISENISAQFICSPKTFDIYIVLYSPHITEETLLHEALHAKNIVQGFPFLLGRAFPEKNTMANLENQIEHMRIFSEMRDMGFDPEAYAQKRWKSGIETIGTDALNNIPSDTEPYVIRAIVATYALGGLVAGISSEEIKKNIPLHFADYVDTGSEIYETLKKYDLRNRAENMEARIKIGSLLRLEDRDALLCEMDFKNRKLSCYNIETGTPLGD